MASHLEVVEEMGWFNAGVKMLLFTQKPSSSIELACLMKK